MSQILCQPDDAAVPFQERANLGDGIMALLGCRLEGANQETGILLLDSRIVRRHVEDAVVDGKSFELELRGKSGSVPAHEVTGLA